MEISPVIRPITHCSKDLEFRSFSEWPAALPGIAINRNVIVGFDHDWVLDYELSVEDPDFANFWVEVFSTAYSSLSWTELVLFSQVLRSREQWPLQILWQHFGYKDSSSLDELGPSIQALPEETQRWLSEKRVGPQELQPLRSLKNASQAKDVELFFACAQRLQLSRQDGMKLLEVWTELLLLDRASDELSPLEAERSSDWIQRLRLLRYPETAKQDQNAKTWVEAQSWPRPTQIRWLRQGDQTGLEIKVIVKKPGDFNTSKKALEDIEALLALAPGDLWH